MKQASMTITAGNFPQTREFPSSKIKNVQSLLTTSNFASLVTSTGLGLFDITLPEFFFFSCTVPATPVCEFRSLLALELY